MDIPYQTLQRSMWAVMITIRPPSTTYVMQTESVEEKLHLVVSSTVDLARVATIATALASMMQTWAVAEHAAYATTTPMGA